MNTIAQFDCSPVVVEAVHDIFDSMLDMNLDYIEQMSQPYLFGKRYLGAVHMSGAVHVSVRIQSGVALTRSMAGAMLGMPEDQIAEEEIRDVVGEIANMIAGSLKSTLNDAGLACELSCPSITTGKDFKSVACTPQRLEYYTFFSGDQEFLVTVGLKDGDLGQAGRNASDSGQADPGLDSEKLRENIANIIAEVFDTMLSMELVATAQPESLETGDNRMVGSVGMAGNLVGQLNMEISEVFGRLITAEMLGMEPDEIEGVDEIRDVVGEVCNMIGGNLKSNLCDIGYQCILSPPDFTSGKDFQVEWLNLTHHESLAFRFNDHPLRINFGYRAA